MKNSFSKLSPSQVKALKNETSAKRRIQLEENVKTAAEKRLAKLEEMARRRRG